MKNNYLIFLLLLTLFSVSSCIQDEAPNAECDILDVDANWLEEHKDIIIRVDKIHESDYDVNFYIKIGTSLEELKSLNPLFKLTEGATIEKNGEPTENGESGIFMYYKTHSEDGEWSKNYKIAFTIQANLPVEHVFSFENYSLDATGKFYTWFEKFKDTQYDWWSSGNAGFATVAGKKPASEYPTTASSEGFSGDCVKLTTLTAPGGALMKMPIAAGSIFIGNFDSENATKLKEKATHFGLQIIPEGHKPVALKGYYKYTAGSVFKDKNNKVVDGRKDECSIYAVLFEIDPNNFIQLDGSNITSSNRIVLMADLKEPGEPAEWKEFNIPFEQMNGKEFDYEKLKKDEYAITIVASSSKNGAFFEGAVGSTLFIDELKIEWEKE